MPRPMSSRYRHIRSDPIRSDSVRFDLLDPTGFHPTRTSDGKIHHKIHHKSKLFVFVLAQLRCQVDPAACAAGPATADASDDAEENSAH